MYDFYQPFFIDLIKKMKTLEQLQTDKTVFSIGQALSDGWKLVSKTIGFYILGGIVAGLMAAAAALIPLLGDIASQVIISPCLMAGAIFITWRISRGIPWTDFGDMFKGFKYLTPVAISSLIQFVVVVILTVGFLLNYLSDIIDLFSLTQGSGAFERQEEIERMLRQMFTPEMLLLFSLLMIVLMFISIIWVFKTHFIVIYNMQAWPAMEMSRKIASRNLLQLFGYFIVMGFIIIISAIPCGIGLLFSLPLMIGSTYSAFAQITNCDQPDEISSEMFDFVGGEDS